MRKNHAVRKQGHFKVFVAQNGSPPGIIRYFQSFELAYRYFRYHVSFLGWDYGVLRFVYYGDKPSQVLFYVDREV